MAKIWRIKPGGPVHYVQGVGLLGPGEEFMGSDTPMSDYVEEVVKAKPAKPGKQPKQADVAEAPEPEPATEGPGAADAPAQDGF